MEAELSMEQKFNDKLNNIIKANLENEQFGVQKLSEEIGMSRSQLHRKLHSINGKSVSRFIREYRLKKAMQMLQNNVATASEIAYRVGFKSATYFTTCFNEYYGYPPGEAKIRNPLTTIESDQTLIAEKGSPRPENIVILKKNILSKRMILANTVGIILLGIFFYFFYQNSEGNNLGEANEFVIIDKSIAILPCKNLSDDKENQYFADGVMVSIEDHLIKLEGLRVIPQTSMEKYRESTMTIPEISEELNTTYFLEATMQKDENKVRFIVKLVDARINKQIWSETYDRELNNIFTIQSEIAKEIATKLKTNLSDSEQSLIDKNPTNNITAYNLYLKGLFFHKLGGPENIEKSLKYLEKSIKEDPEYALAYVGIADIYLGWMMGGKLYGKDVLNRVRDLALKSIALDNSLAQPHATLGVLEYIFEWNWEAAEKKFLIAIELNSKNATIRSKYALYLHFLGRFDEAREQINQAQLLDPTSYHIYSTSAIFYNRIDNTEKALEEINKAIEINKDIKYLYWTNFTIYLLHGYYDSAVEKLLYIFGRDPAKKLYIDTIDQTYKRSGINGVMKRLIDLDLFGHKYNSPYYYAQVYSFIGDHDKALSLLEESLELRISHMVNIKSDLYFKNLRSEPRFIALLEKMGLNNTEPNNNPI